MTREDKRAAFLSVLVFVAFAGGLMMGSGLTIMQIGKAQLAMMCADRTVSPFIECKGGR